MIRCAKKSWIIIIQFNFIDYYFGTCCILYCVLPHKFFPSAPHEICVTTLSECCWVLTDTKSFVFMICENASLSTSECVCVCVYWWGVWTIIHASYPKLKLSTTEILVIIPHFTGKLWQLRQVHRMSICKLWWMS